MGMDIDLYEYKRYIAGRGDDDVDTLLHIGRDKPAYLVDVADMPAEWRHRLPEDIDDDATILVVVND